MQLPIDCLDKQPFEGDSTSSRLANALTQGVCVLCAVEAAKTMIQILNLDMSSSKSNVPGRDEHPCFKWLWLASALCERVPATAPWLWAKCKIVWVRTSYGKNPITNIHRRFELIHTPFLVWLKATIYHDMQMFKVHEQQV